MSTAQAKYPYDVFISYSRSDKEWVEGWLLPRLVKANLRVITERDFLLGISLLQNIENAINASRYILLVLTPAWKDSSWIEFEVLLALTHDPANQRSRVLPILLKSEQPLLLPMVLNSISLPDFRQQERWEVELERLIATVRGELEQHDMGRPHNHPRIADTPFDAETIAWLFDLLATHRRTLAHLLQQAAMYGGVVFAPPLIANGITEAREQISRIKATLRENGIQIENEVNDRWQGAFAAPLGKEDISDLQQLLVIYRKTLAIYLKQQAIHGTAYTSPLIQQGIAEARANISHIKEILRENGIRVEDAPNDEEVFWGAIIHRDLRPRNILIPAPSLKGAIRMPLNIAWFSALRQQLQMQTLAIGFFGLALVFFAIGITSIAAFAPFYRVVYVIPPASPPSLLLNPAFWTVLFASLIAALIGIRARTLFRGMLAVLVVVTLALAVLLLLNKPLMVAHAAEQAQPTTPIGTTSVPTAATTQTAATSPTAVVVPPYRGELHVTGPETLRFGSSATVVLIISVVSNTSADPAIPLLAASGYTATVRAQVGNFDVDKAVEGMREEQALSLRSPAQWTWVITPKEKRLGPQSLAFDVFIFDQKRTRVPTPSSTLGVYITDPIGLPAWIVYAFGAIGAILGALGILPVLYERYLKPKPEVKPQPVANTSTAPPQSLSSGAAPIVPPSAQPTAFTARLMSDITPGTPSIAASKAHPSAATGDKSDVGGRALGAEGEVDPKQQPQRQSVKRKTKGSDSE